MKTFFHMVLWVVVMISLAGTAAHQPVHAETSVAGYTFQVNTTADQEDANPGDGVCLSSAGKCSLRAAVMEANALTGSLTNVPVVIINLPAGTYTLTSIAGKASELELTGSTIQIIGADRDTTIIDGGNLSMVFSIQSVIGNVDFRLFNLTIQHGKSIHGGGIAIGGMSGTVLIDNCVLQNNQATGAGGALNAGDFTRVMIINSTIKNNTASDRGGGIHNEGALISIINSTLSGNTSQYIGGAINSAIDYGVTKIINSTISGNQAQVGGGVSAERSSTVFLYHATLTANSASASGGGFATPDTTWNPGGVLPGGTINFSNSIVAGNQAPLGPDLTGTAVSGDYNLIGIRAGWIGSAGANDLTEAAAQLGPLANNGGPTATHALLPGSPAIDHGSYTNDPETFLTSVNTDQRGILRLQDGDADGGTTPDIGAFELKPATTIELAEQVGGMIRTFSVQGNLVYLATAARFEILNISNPAGITRLSSLNYAQDRIKDLAAASGYAYLATPTGGLRVIDARSPAAPVQVASIEMGLAPDFIRVSGSYLYLVSATILQVFDISNPASPTFVGEFADEFQIHDIAFKGEYAWIIGKSAILVINNKFPAFPYPDPNAWGGGVVRPDNMISLDLSSQFAFTAGSDENIFYWPISTPTQLFPVAKAIVPQDFGPATDLVFDQNRLYMPRSIGMYIEGRIDVFDVTAPESAALLASVEGVSEINHLEVINKTAYIADYTDGFYILDLTTPTIPRQLGFYQAPWYYDFDVEQNQGVAAMDEGGLSSFSLVSSQPVIQNTKSVQSLYPQVELYHGVAYMTVDKTITAFTVGSGGALVKSSEFSIPDTVCEISEIVPSGTLLLLAETNCGSGATGGGIRFLNINTPSSLTQAAYYPLTGTGGAAGLAVQSNLLYVSDQSFGLRILNFSNLASIQEVGTLSYAAELTAQSEQMGAITVQNNTAFIVKGFGSIRMIDVTSTSSPVEKAQYNLKSVIIFRLSACGDYLLLSTGFSGLQVVNIKDPLLPSLEGQAPGIFSTLHASLINNFIYTADRGGGLLVYRMQTAVPVDPTKETLITSPSGETTLSFPANTFSSAGTVSFQPILEPTTGVPGNAVGSMQLNAWDANHNPITSLSQPLTITIHYDPAKLRGAMEKTGKIYLWNADQSKWLDAAQTCSPAYAYTYDFVNHTISVKVCHLTEFSLVYPYQMFLPKTSNEKVYSISGQVTDQAGSPISGISIGTDTGVTATTGTDGRYALVGLRAKTYTITPQSDTRYHFDPVSQVVILAADTSGVNFTAVPNASDYIINGGFEDKDGWEINTTDIMSAFSSTQAHSGSKSMQAGLFSGSVNVKGYSKFRQTVTIPTAVKSAKLSFWMYPYSNDSGSADCQYITIMDSGGSVLEYLVKEQRRNDQSWVQYQFDLTKYAGKLIKIVFVTYNDGAGGMTGMYIDDASLMITP